VTHEIEQLSCADLLEEADDPHFCKCKDIVLNAYNNLKNSGLSESEAINIVVPILKHHHASPTFELKTVIECWVREHKKSALH
jgi:hypothetical protein